MNYYIVMLGALLLSTSNDITFAEYQDPTVTKNQRLAGGAFKLELQFTGNAGEPSITREYIGHSSTTLRDVREWAYLVIDELNGYQAAASLPGLQVGTVVRKVAPQAIVLTPKQQWQRDYRKCKRLEESGLAGAINEQVTACKSALAASYQAGFEDD